MDSSREDLSPMESGEPVVISAVLLLWPYSLSVLFLSFAIVDVFFLQSVVKSHLPQDFSSLFLLIYILDLPHIVAGFPGLVDAEYIAVYGRKISLGIPLVVCLTLAIAVANPLIIMALYAILTMNHVIAQQVGIAGMFLQKRGKAFFVWKWLPIVCSALIYLVVFTTMKFWTVEDITRIVFPCAWAIYLTVTWILLRQAVSAIGRMHVLSLSATLLLSSILVSYSAFVTFMLLLLVHNIVAYIYYIAHDSSRSTLQVKNVFYRLLRPLGLPVYVILPVFSLSVTWLVYFLIHVSPPSVIMGNLLYGLFASLPFIHYYTEHFIWRAGSPHRREIKVRAS
ncbi:MAG: hypothetical protein PHC51_09565 [bacterium]|nr:hypothetical protein [bacterium]